MLEVLALLGVPGRVGQLGLRGLGLRGLGGRAPPFGRTGR